MTPVDVFSGQPEVYWNDSPGAQHRLLADDARAFDFLDVAGRVGDDPVAAEELHRLVAFVGDAHGVVEEPLALKRLRVLRRVLRLDLDAHVVGDGFRAVDACSG